MGGAAGLREPARAGGPESRARRAGTALPEGLGTIQGGGGVRVPPLGREGCGSGPRPPDSLTQERGKEGGENAAEEEEEEQERSPNSSAHY